jgi:glycosyltransferase domain-containing protein
MHHQKITILVPTKNRPKYIQRLVGYVQHLPFQFIIGDTSSSPSLVLNKDLTNITYHHLPGLHFTDKINFLISKVNTPYCMLCADDDFLIPDGISQCIQFLEANEDYVCCTGRTLSFLQIQNQVVLKEIYSNAAFAQKHTEVEQRLIHYFNPYRPIYYAVHQTSNLVKSFSIKVEPLNLNLTEFAFAFITFYNGPVKLLPCYYHIREELPQSAGAAFGTLENVMSLDSQKSTQQQFVNTLTQYIAATANKAHATKWVNLAISQYLNFVNGKNINGKTSFINSITKGFLKPYLPWLYYKSIQLKNKILNGKVQPTKQQQAVLAKLSISENEELQKVLRYVAAS